MVLVGFGPVSLLLLVDYVFLAGNIFEFLSVAVVFSILICYLLAGNRFMSRKIGAVVAYAKSMGTESELKSAGSAKSRIGIVTVWGVFMLGFATIGGLPKTSEEFFADHVFAVAFLMAFLAAFVWAYGVSMLTISRLGGSRLDLRSHVEDRTLGLKPFGVASLQLTGVYIAIPVALAIISAFSATSLIDFILIGSLTLTGLVFFFLPLRSFHRKLRQAKKTELNWISSRYSRLIQQIKDGSDASSASATNKEAVASELLMVRSIQQDARQIQEWPVDLTIMFRLVTVLALPPVLGVIARILILTILHI